MISDSDYKEVEDALSRWEWAKSEYKSRSSTNILHAFFWILIVAGLVIAFAMLAVISR